MTDIFEVIEQLSGARFYCQPHQSVLHAMERHAKRCVPVGCRGGGCGRCKVKIISGKYQCGPMSSAHVPATAREQGEVLACRVYPLSRLEIECRSGKAVNVLQPYNNSNEVKS